jgi:toxin CptA
MNADPVLEGVLLALALLCAAAMGLAIQRGGTCTVAAVDEWLRTRRPTRALAMLEAALWVGAGVLLAHALGLGTALPAGHAVTAWTVAGAVLLGLGAVLNQACVIGTVARLGNGHWAWAATPPGFYLGSLAASAGRPALPAPGGLSPLLSVPPALVALLLTLFAARALQALWRRRRALTAAWTPHAATVAIGVVFALLLVLAGAWSYTDVLADLARDMAANLNTRLALGAALFTGAVLGGALTHQLGRHALHASQLLRCAAGGVLMGAGSAWIPGGNDNLILLGLPLLWPNAWVGMVLMALTVALALHAGRRRSAV